MIQLKNRPDKVIYSILVPIFNEAESIFPFYDRIINVMVNLRESFELIFINDGSTDESLNILYQLYQNDKRLKILSLSRNFGKEIALTAGLDYSVGEAVIPIDVDLQDPPELIPCFIEKWKSGFEVVYATRTYRHGETFIKKITAKLFYYLIKKLSKIDIPINTGDYRLMDRKVVDALKKLREQHRFMKGLFSWVGFKQISIQYKRDSRYTGKSKWNYIKLINLAIDGITSFSHIPLKLSWVLGIVLFLTGLIFSFIIIIKIFIFNKLITQYSFITLCFLFFFSIILFNLGIIGEYIGRIYSESKNRKLYFISESYGFSHANNMADEIKLGSVPKMSVQKPSILNISNNNKKF